MKKILCYGDSNTWGQAAFGGRIDDEKQWPNILQTLLTRDDKIIQEGLSGRVAGDFDTKRPYRNGKSSYEVILRSADPDCIVIALGTNDVHYDRSAQQIVDDLLWYADFSRQMAEKFKRPTPLILYILPPNFVSSEYYDGDERLRQEVVRQMKQTGHACIELPALTMTEDGVHYSLETHNKVANIVYQHLMKGRTK